MLDWYVANAADAGTAAVARRSAMLLNGRRAAVRAVYGLRDIEDLLMRKRTRRLRARFAGRQFGNVVQVQAASRLFTISLCPLPTRQFKLGVPEPLPLSDG